MASWLLTMILIPLAGSALNGIFLRPHSAKRAGVIASLCVGASFICAVLLASSVGPLSGPVTWSYDWFGLQSFPLTWGFHFDTLTAVMCLLVTGVGTLIHLYSIGYMSDDPTPGRYFSYLNLFVFSMLVLVCADSLPVVFVGWEGVGLCSYLLIGYWYKDLNNVKAANKAFVFNRIGDAGFLLGSFLCFQLFHSLRFTEIAAALSQAQGMNVLMLNVAALLLFVGATGKSAQVPLYVWLPDAMAGPTPVSALIHAATMVTAGIYLLVRLQPLFHVAEQAGFVISAIGGMTALIGAVCATAQRDIKKVLAYSTISQLGLMFLGLGAGAVLGAMFHLLTHAFFKALLFLGAGSVIHALGGEQDISKMGGLKKDCPVTYATFLVGALALAGLPPFSGFFSKDLLLYEAWVGLPAPFGWLALGTGLTVSFLTAFYIARLLALTFLGESRHGKTAHESPALMTFPLVVLAGLALGGGLIAFPEEWRLLPNGLHNWLLPYLNVESTAHVPIPESVVMVASTLVGLAGLFLGLWRYKGTSKITLVEAGPASRLYVDEFYAGAIGKPFGWLAIFFERVVEFRFIDVVSLWPARVCQASGAALSLLQSGSAQSYLLVLVLGAIVVLWFTLKGSL